MSRVPLHIVTRGVASSLKCTSLLFLMSLVAGGRETALLGPTGDDLGVTFTNIAKQAGITARTVYGDEHRNRFLLETTGCGAAFIDYDNDGWLDIFLVNGTRFEAKYPKGSEPTTRL